jgi:hypothetical protein
MLVIFVKADRGNSCVSGDVAVLEFGARVPGDLSAIAIDPFAIVVAPITRGTTLVLLHLV